MALAKQILVADDDPKILKVVGEALKLEGYQVVTAVNGNAALQVCRQSAPDLIILDITMPGLDGLEVVHKLRTHGSQVPILILSARGDETDRVVGFRLGADDYLTKPFSISELVLRVRAILRRAGAPAPVPIATPDRISAGDLVIDRVAHQVTVRGTCVELTPLEFKLLWLLASNPGQVFSRDHLLERVWQSEYEGDQAAVTVYIRRLREKIERNPGDPEHIKTVWGIGYKFD